MYLSAKSERKVGKHTRYPWTSDTVANVKAGHPLSEEYKLHYGHYVPRISVRPISGADGRGQQDPLCEKKAAVIPEAASCHKSTSAPESVTENGRRAVTTVWFIHSHREHFSLEKDPNVTPNVWVFIIMLGAFGCADCKHKSHLASKAK